MTALDIAIGVVSHANLALGILGLSRLERLDESAVRITLTFALGGLFGACYFWARLAGFP